MNISWNLNARRGLLSVCGLLFLSSPISEAKSNPIETVQQTAESQIHRLLDPILDKYCHDECRLLSIHVEADLLAPENQNPGFDEATPSTEEDYIPTSAEVKILIDEKVGPNSRGKLLELLQQYLDTLNFETKLTTQTTRFPVPKGSESKVAEMREKVSQQFTSILEDLIHQFCPQSCLLADFNLQTDTVNGEETQYGNAGEFIQDGDTAIRIRSISATLLMDQTLSPEEQSNILEMAKLKTNSFKHRTLTAKTYKFPHPQTESKASRNPASDPEKTPLQSEIDKLKFLGLIFCAAVFLFICFFVANYLRSKHSSSNQASSIKDDESSIGNSQKTLALRYEVERLYEELMTIYAQQPKVAKHVFSRILSEDGIETTAHCVHLFGEGIMNDMLKDPKRQGDLAELLEYYAQSQIELTDDQKLALLKKLNSRTVAGKLTLLGQRSFRLFDFLTELTGRQILELIRGEPLTVKAIVLTQCDAQKRIFIYEELPPDARIELLAELSRIDYLPKDYLNKVSATLKQKLKENPKFNTEALPGSEVLVSLLERTDQDTQKSIVKSLELTHPQSVQTIKNKLISLDTLLYLPQEQLLNIVMSLKHDELIVFLKCITTKLRSAIFTQSPPELAADLEEEVTQLSAVPREVYHNVERKILNKIKTMSTDGQLDLLETNERIFSNDVFQPGASA